MGKWRTWDEIRVNARLHLFDIFKGKNEMDEFRYEVDEDLISPPSRPRGLMRWNPHGEFWEFTSPFSVVDTVESTPETRKLFLTNDYKALFPAFKAGDIVTATSDLQTCDVFVHMKLRLDHSPLPHGVYVVDVGSSGIILRAYSGVIDDYVALPHSVEQLPADMNLFFNKRSTYENLGLRHKRGALVYGPPGNGKTFRIMKCATEFVKNFDCLVFTLSNSIRTVDFLQYLAPVVKGRNNIVIIEEIMDKAVNDIQATLRFLDGDTSWDNSYIIATTNYPEKLPANLIDRPGRFDVLMEVNDPDDASRKTYMEHFIGPINEEVLVATKGYSIAYLREMIVRSKLDNVSLESTLKNMKDRKAKIKNKFKEDESFGRFM